jgi:hypothetical protein
VPLTDHMSAQPLSPSRSSAGPYRSFDTLGGLLLWDLQACSDPLYATSVDATKEKAERWTRRRAFAQVRHGSNIQLPPYSLVTRHA